MEDICTALSNYQYEKNRYRNATNQGVNILPEVKLFISRIEDGQYQVVVNGTGFYQAENAKVGIRILGEDTWFDDDLFSIGVGMPGHVLGGTFTMGAIVPGSSLNEDWGDD